MDDVIDKVLDSPEFQADVRAAYWSDGDLVFYPNGRCLAGATDSLEAPKFAAELTRLSVENARLRAELSAMKGASDGR